MQGEFPIPRAVIVGGIKYLLQSILFIEGSAIHEDITCMRGNTLIQPISPYKCCIRIIASEVIIGYHKLPHIAVISFPSGECISSGYHCTQRCFASVYYSVAGSAGIYRTDILPVYTRSYYDLIAGHSHIGGLCYPLIRMVSTSVPTA